MGKTNTILKGIRGGLRAFSRRTRYVGTVEELALAAQERATAKVALEKAREVLKVAEGKAKGLHGVEQAAAQAEVTAARRAAYEAEALLGKKTGHYHYIRSKLPKESSVATEKKPELNHLEFEPDQARNVLVNEALEAIERAGIESAADIAKKELQVATRIRDEARVAFKKARADLRIAEKHLADLHYRGASSAEIQTAERAVVEAEKLTKARRSTMVSKEQIYGKCLKRVEGDISAWIGGPLVLQEKIESGESLGFWDAMDMMNPLSVPEMVDALVQGEPVSVADVGLAGLEFIENPLDPIMDISIDSNLSALEVAKTSPTVARTAAAMGKAVQEIAKQETEKPSVWEIAEGKTTDVVPQPSSSQSIIIF
ncbi:MAG: hypothetical protein K1X66_00325 [Verrucomicrobiae bacterium]|nr:hypothetical protein [Verrucomicrobiae bacterium]